MENFIDLDDVRTTAEAFFDAMKEWEIWSATLDYDASTSKQRLHELQPIFKKYLSNKALARRQSRYDLLNFGTPPSFRQPIVLVEEAKKGDVWIYVLAGTLGGRKRYLWKKEKDEWRIDHLETDIANNAAWKKYLDI